MDKKIVTSEKKPVAKNVSSKTTSEKSATTSAAKKADSLGYFARTSPASDRG